ncbi:helix-turn-helix transcriptional regulator [Pseudaminobacter sp. 19-2017]|uniref:Helix-turn-helix transcriptional regulator n=2 Tax=Pseudaminobacter soli (ex Zhang et al. 2022) TaxID=2831468 RepID=A0A942IAC0_9HYPH|nr:helix-turn-helix transcriptional regulator [Pseudaminobacter soli]
MAGDLNASEFSLFTMSVALERTRPVPWFDSQHPGVSEATRLIAGPDGEHLLHHARTSTLPCWWDDVQGSLSLEMLAKPDMGRRLDGFALGLSGIAFPVFGAAGRGGLVVFLGREIAIDEELCLDIHTRCFALFESLSKLGTNELDKMPVVSKRELECLKLTANGMTSEQIAAALKLSVHTANQYLTNSTQKLNAANRVHAVAKALKLGLIG